MKEIYIKKRRWSATLLISCLLLIFMACGSSEEGESSVNELQNDLPHYNVKFDSVRHGSLTVVPEIESDTSYPEGTEITVSVETKTGYELDSIYYTVSGPYGPLYMESMTSPMTIRLQQDITIGAAFVRSDDLEGFTVIQDIVYAQPGIKPLKYDIYSPEGAENLPIIAIIHGGGWSINDENIMRGMAREMVRTGKYVVASVDYRWVGLLDGDEKENTPNGLIEDVFGALVHIQEHAHEYGADPGRIAVTGDSAGGHLSASAVTMVNRIGRGGFGNGVYEFVPSYVPSNLDLNTVRDNLRAAIKVAAPSYGVFDLLHQERFEVTEEERQALSPIFNIPPAQEQSIPHYLIRGTVDPLISEEMVASYAAALSAAGQTVKHVEVSGASHAFFDWKPDSVTKRTFEKFGVPYIADMMSFLDAYL